MNARSHIHFRQASTECKIEHGFIPRFVHTYMFVHACTYACVHAEMQLSLYGCYLPVNMKNHSITNHFMYTSIAKNKTLLVELKSTCRLNTKVCNYRAWLKHPCLSVISRKSNKCAGCNKAVHGCKIFQNK